VNAQNVITELTYHFIKNESVPRLSVAVRSRPVSNIPRLRLIAWICLYTLGKKTKGTREWRDRLS
jgi:hypothetical protein